ncbi:MAG TPA: M2 family metallopeptidase [Candidatus Eisenbacteria bacterium]
METPKSTEPERRAALAEFIQRLVAEVEPLHRQHNQAVWMANITGEARHEEESARLDAAIRKIFARPEPYRFLCGLLEGGAIPDPILQRQLVLLHHEHRAHQIPPETIDRLVRLEKGLESQFNNFRAQLDGRRVTDNEIREILTGSDDPEQRRSAWEASKQIGAEVVADLLELVRLRNQAANDLDFANYYSMMLELDELDEGELFSLLQELERGTRPLFERYKRELDLQLGRRFGIEPAALRPWHYSDPFFQEAPAAGVGLDRYFAHQSLEALTERFFGAVGFSIRDLLERADLYEKPGKSQHAFCLCMDRAADIRVLCNLRPNEYWMGTMLHEYGHAVYDQSIDPSLPYLLRVPAHTLTTEASAMLFGRLSKNADWLARHAGVPEDEARVVGETLARATRSQLLVQVRWCLVMSQMERALYRNPTQDLDSLWWDLVEEFQWVRRPDERHAPDWASKIHFSVAPVYYHNYMLGEIMASQLQAHILRQLLGDGEGVWRRYVTSPLVGGFLKGRLYRSGKSTDWRETLRQATGQALNVGTFVDELASRS